jgi:hypothetical protein
MMAVGSFAIAVAVAGLAAAAGFAGAGGLLAAAWPTEIDAEISNIPKIANAVRMDAPWKRSVNC